MRSLVLALMALSITHVCFAQEVSLRRTFTLDLPGRPVFGERPERKIDSVEIKLPSGFDAKRDQGIHGLVEIEKKRDGLDEEELKIEPIDGGVKVTWRLKNPDVLPHKASLTVELKGVPSTSAIPGFSTKYIAFRKRFLETFYHKGRISCWTLPAAGQEINFGDQTIEMGTALMVFSTEMAIYRKLGQSVDEPRKLVLELLNAFDELDKKAESLYGAPEAPLNGFFVRDDISGPSDPRLSRTYAKVNSDWQLPKDASPSGDQIFAMMSGLLSVVRYSGDVELTEKAKGICRRTFDYAKRNKFILRLPNGDPNERGEDLRWLSSLLHGINQHITGDDLFGDCRIQLGLGETGLKPIASFWDTKSIHKMMPKVFNKDLTELLPVPLRVIVPKKDGKPLKFNSFAIHIILMAMAPSNIMSQEDFEAAGLKANHHAAVLWWCRLHNLLPQGTSSADIQKILDACPEPGPHGGLSAESGWNTDSRWVRCTNIHQPPQDNRLHNGLDWLLLHNLHEMVYKR
jgi:hypothetical protein